MPHPLSPVTRKWFSNRFGSPTAIQISAWEALADGNHILAVAPTGSGKTLAAFLLTLDRLLTRNFPSAALQVLYVSPLKALGVDVRENLTGPLLELRAAFAAEGFTEIPDIRIGIRNGDTTPAERRRQLKSPPEILITTPESLNNLLLSNNGRKMLSCVEVFILDELHAIASNRRGTMATCAMERLAEIAGEYQRIGLTATVRPLEKAAAFFGGYRPDESGEKLVPRPVKVLSPPSKKRIRISIEDLPKEPFTESSDHDYLWRELAGKLRSFIQHHQTTLIFIDSRRWAEKMARLINEGQEEILAWAHHGSLSKDMRRLVERRLKEGQIRAVVATGSLELGIDVGPLDRVILLRCPASPSATLQRAGRAGHRPYQASLAHIYPMAPPEMLAASVLSKMAENGEIELLRIPENPLDMLAQILLGLCVEKGRREEELWNMVRRVWCFRNLPRQSFDAVLAMLRGRYAETRIKALQPQLYRSGEHLIARPGTQLRLYSTGAIPDLGLYPVKVQGATGVLGSLDEEFVWESRPGMVFHLGNRRWRITVINDREVTVVPTEEAISTEAFWRAESRNRDADYARRITELLRDAENIIADESHHPDAAEDQKKRLENYLTAEWNLADEPAASLALYLRKQRLKTHTPLPHRGHIVAEASADPLAGSRGESRLLFLHTGLGGQVNRPLALALEATWRKKSPTPALPTVTDEIITFRLDDGDVEPFVQCLHSLTNPEALIRGVLEATPFFGGHFRKMAGRALLLPSSTPRRRQPLWMTRQRSRILLESVLPYPDFPLLAEVWRSILNDEFNMEALQLFLDDLRAGRISITIIRTPTPSPFASSAAQRRLAERMTANVNDESNARFVSNLESKEIQRLTRAGTLRPRIPRELIQRLDGRRRRLENGYAPSSEEGLRAWIAEREAFDAEDWNLTLAAVERETGRNAAAWEAAVAKTLKRVSLGPLQTPWMVEAERADEWVAAFATAIPEPHEPGTTALVNPGAAAHLAAFWLAGRGPMEKERILQTFGLEPTSPAAAMFLGELAEGGKTNIIMDQISDNRDCVELADPEAMEILLRWRRRQSRNTDAPLPAECLASFLARRQNLIHTEGGEEGLAATLAVLEGYPARAEMWETAILPARLQPYRPADLDTLVEREEVIWVGAGRRQVAFLTAEGGHRFPTPETWATEAPLGPPFPEPGDAPMSYWDLVDALEADSAEAAEKLWRQVWSGRLTADGAAVLRRAVLTNFQTAAASDLKGRRPGRLRGWAAGRPIEGRWYAPAYAEEPAQSLESDHLLRDRVRLLIGRYGVLSRPLLENEIPPWRWSALSRVLSLMELGDELLGGQWFESLPMPQFLLPETLPFWRDGAPAEEGWVLNAADPASPCGIPGISNLPPRRDSAWMGWNANCSLDMVLTPGRGSLEIPLPQMKSSASNLNRLTKLLTERSVNPQPRVVIRTINGSEPLGDGERLLQEAGFTPSGSGEWVHRAEPIGKR